MTTTAEAELAINGGRPVRSEPLPYSRQTIDDDDVRAVVAALRSEWLTTGPAVAEFERAFADATGAAHAVAVSSGTAALHAAVHALGIGLGDEVIVPAMTFAASANCVVYEGGTPVFADVDPETLLLDPATVHITPRTKAIIAVDYAGQPCDYDALRAFGLPVIADACHALGGSNRGAPVGSLAVLSAFSLHAVKHVTTGEGGVITTDDAELARRMRVFRNHGITRDHREREREGSWFYEMVELGFNYRITDFQCALGTSQLRKLPASVARRRSIAERYGRFFAGTRGMRPLRVRDGVTHAYHLYPVLLEGLDRAAVFRALRAEGIGCNVHYIPVHLHPFYRERFGTRPGLCPVAEAAYEKLITLPMFPAMSDRDADDVLEACAKVLAAYA
ncbi:MAG TPA: UDP-4-amino-4,6-dideoxy-N-acetyl-beta-L-altrosamine transaminase [Thermoanaerobaculia bacterium]|nr:UDP-4-amino-4,6-dideoxy-N-acetyl-beta-L-altrosamine transaminase [Thermoanaerobaculia bacterium]